MGGMSNHINIRPWDVIIHPCPEFSSGLAKPKLILWHEWAIFNLTRLYMHSSQSMFVKELRGNSLVS